MSKHGELDVGDIEMIMHWPFFKTNKEKWMMHTTHTRRGKLKESGPDARGRTGQENGAQDVVIFGLATGTRPRHGWHGHETIHPFVNHQLLFSCSIQ